MANKATLFSNFKGINRFADIVNMPSDFLFDIYNGYQNKQNSISKRFGYSKAYSAQVDSGANITNFYEAVYDDGSTDFFVVTATKIFRWDSGGATWSSIKTGLTSSDFSDIVQYADEVVFSNGVEAPQKFIKGGISTSDLTMPAGVTTFIIMHIHNGRLWGVNPDDNYQVHYSALDDIEDWTTTGDAGYGFEDLQYYVSKGDEIQAIETFSRNSLVVFMNDHTILYQAGAVASDFGIIQINKGTGVTGRNAVLSFGSDLFYLDKDSPKSFQSSLANEELDINDFSKGLFGEYYRDLLDGLDSDRLCLEKYLRKSWVVINVPTGSSTSDLLIWDYVAGQWAGRWVMNDRVNQLFQNNAGDFLFASEGYVYKFDESVYTDDSASYEFIVQTPYYWGRDPAAYEKYNHLEVLIESGTTATELEIQAFYGLGGNDTFFDTIDLEADVSLWNVAEWDVDLWDSTGQEVYRVPMIGRGKLVRIVFRNDQSGKSLTIKMWQLFPTNEGVI